MRHETFPSAEVLDDLARLERMRAYILEHGWCQDQAEDREGSVCLLGAGLGIEGLLETPLHLRQDTDYQRRLVFQNGRTARLLGFVNSDEVAKFNDREGTTLFTVLQRIDDAAAWLRSKT